MTSPNPVTISDLLAVLDAADGPIREGYRRIDVAKFMGFPGPAFLDVPTTVEAWEVESLAVHAAQRAFMGERAPQGRGPVDAVVTPERIVRA